jgi:hypothetical protein
VTALDVDYIGPILALLTGAAGWYYLFYSRAAARLGEFEAQRVNDQRARLRRIGGGVMLFLGAGLYIGFRTADADNGQPFVFVAAWLANMALMAVLVVLALVDVRLTARLRKNLRPRDPTDARTPIQDRRDPPEPGA